MKMLSQICHFFKQILKLLFHVSVLFRKTLFQIFIFQQTPFFLCQPHFFFQKRIYTAGDFNLINHFYDIVNEKSVITVLTPIKLKRQTCDILYDSFTQYDSKGLSATKSGKNCPNAPQGREKTEKKPCPLSRLSSTFRMAATLFHSALLMPPLNEPTNLEK